ncbi:MAG: nitroreductase family protein [Nanoarchaeota archaeon]|nr:nitroreductase family protein [Nanoarchaeota archaeon]
MQFKNVFLGRRSIRKYKEQEVPMSLVGEIIDLARYTPSSGNLQSWRFIVVTDTEKRNKIADACLQQFWMTSAPVYIVVCNDYDDVKKHYGKLGKMYSIQNCANVSMAITLIAYELGLGSCWVGGFDNEAIQRILNIPDNMDPEVIITLGYSNEVKKPSLRDDPNYMTFYNEWGNNFTKLPSHLDQLQKKLSSVKKKIIELKK